jgi:hypothetical protein
MNALPYPKKDGEACSECGGSGWTRYYSETITGDIEEAFRLCERCNSNRRLPCEARSAWNRQPLPRAANQEDSRSSLVLLAVLKASAVELRALEEALEKREPALFYLSVYSQLAEYLGARPLCSVVRYAAQEECHANAARSERETGEV